jgi:hypothetical protein
MKLRVPFKVFFGILDFEEIHREGIVPNASHAAIEGRGQRALSYRNVTKCAVLPPQPPLKDVGYGGDGGNMLTPP